MLAAQGFAGRADARLEIVCGLIPHLGFKSLTLRQYNPLCLGCDSIRGNLFASVLILVRNWYSVKGACLLFFAVPAAVNHFSLKFTLFETRIPAAAALIDGAISVGAANHDSFLPCLFLRHFIARA